MVKIPLTIEQINALFKWRDEHKEIVRACVVPFPYCEIISENGVKIRVQQNEDFTSVYNFTVSNTVLHEVKGRFDYMTITGKVVYGVPQLSHDDTQTAITVWATVMAYIVNFEPEIIEQEYDEPENKESKRRSTSPRKQKRPGNRILYLNPTKYITESKNVVQRKYTPPSCAFSVRGHYRHMKSGKVVYVHPYEKYTGKEKDKRNKIVKIVEV